MQARRTTRRLGAHVSPPIKEAEAGATTTLATGRVASYYAGAANPCPLRGGVLVALIAPTRCGAGNLGMDIGLPPVLCVRTHQQSAGGANTGAC